MRSPALATPAAPASISQVSGPQVEIAKGLPTVDVSVGPSQAFARGKSPDSQGVVGQRPSKVIILGQAPTKPPADSHLH